MLLKNKENIGIIGVSPFNSYFSTTKIQEMIETTRFQHKRLKVFFPGELSIHTLLAKDYTPAKAKKSLSKQNRYCINKIKTALSSAHYTAEEIEQMIIQPQDFENDQNYQNYVNKYQKLYLNDNNIKDSLNNIIKPVLGEYSEKVDNLSLAANYVIGELPFILNANAILNCEDSSFYYPYFHKNFHKLKDLGNTRLIDYELQKSEKICINF